MSFKINRRRLQKIYNRLKNLPGGINFFRYSLNKANGFILKATKSTKVPYPSSIMMEVTNHCNLGCITCPREYAFGQAMAKGTIDIDKMKKVVNEVGPYVDSIGLTGLGETLLYKKLEEILCYIKSKNKCIQTFISTNAHTPGAESYVERMAPYLDTLQISIDGVGKTYEAVRLKSDYRFFFETASKLIEVCKRNNVSVLFNFVAVKENFRQMKDVIQLASDLGVPYVNFTPVNVGSITTAHLDYYDLFYSNEFKDELRKAFELSKQLGNVDLSLWDVEKKNEFKKCHLPWNHFYISWDGYMTPCCAKPFPKELNFGNVFETSLMQCLNSKEYRQFRKMWYQNITPEFCKKCHVVEMKPIELDFDIALN